MSDSEKIANSSSQPAPSEPAKIPTQSSAAAKRELRKFIDHASKVIIACALLMWSVFNISINVLAFKNSEAGLAWGVSIFAILISCGIPFGIGLWMLFKSLSKKA